jgi:hypothetical protein
MALANVLGFHSNDTFNRSLQCEKTDDRIDEFSPALKIENIAQFITLPPYADVKFCFECFCADLFVYFSPRNI